MKIDEKSLLKVCKKTNELCDNNNDGLYYQIVFCWDTGVFDYSEHFSFGQNSRTIFSGNVSTICNVYGPIDCDTLRQMVIELNDLYENDGYYSQLSRGDAI